MKLYLVLKEVKTLSNKISFDTPVYIDKKHSLTSFNKRNDGYIIPQKKKITTVSYLSNIGALLCKLNTIRKLKKDYLDYELVLPNTNPFVKAKFIYDRTQEIVFLTEDNGKFTVEQFDRFCDYYQIEDKNSLNTFINTKLDILPARLISHLQDILRMRISAKDKYLIPLLITKINKF